MGKHSHNQFQPSSAELTRLLLTVTEWTADEMVVIDGLATYTVAPGLALRDVPCILCHRPLASAPFQLHTLVAPVQCASGGAHLYGFTVIWHAGCVQFGEADFGETILANLNCTDG